VNRATSGWTKPQPALEPPRPVSRMTAGAPSPVHHRCSLYPPMSTRCPGGGVAARSFRVASHWYVAPVTAVTTNRPHRPTRMRIVHRRVSTFLLSSAPCRTARVSECAICTRRRTLSSALVVGVGCGTPNDCSFGVQSSLLDDRLFKSDGIGIAAREVDTSTATTDAGPQRALFARWGTGPAATAYNAVGNTVGS
jgi:hypothetical protein